MTGLSKMAEILINHKANVNAVEPKEMNTPLHLAAFYDINGDNSAVVEQLINAGANVNAVNSKNETPLDIAKSDRSKFINLEFYKLNNSFTQYRIIILTFFLYYFIKLQIC